MNLYGYLLTASSNSDLVKRGVNCKSNASIDVRTGTFLKQVTDYGVEVLIAEEVSGIEADHVILAMGYKAESSLFDEVASEIDASDVFNIGDSQQARTIMAAIWDGYGIGRSL